MAGKGIGFWSIPLLFAMQAVNSVAAEFDLHDHSQNQDTMSKWSDTQQGIKLVIEGNDTLHQDSNGLGIEDDHAASELDGKDGHNDKMTFTFFDEFGDPLNVVIKSLRLTMYEPKVAQDAGKLVQLDGKDIATLNASLDFRGAAGFGKDRHTNNSWSLEEDVRVMKGFSIEPDTGAGFYVYSIEVEPMNMPAQFVSKPIISAPEGRPYLYRFEIQDEEPESVTFNLEQGPEGMYLEPLEQTIKWEIGFESEGQYPVVVTANDSEGQISKHSFTLEITNRNQSPTFASTPELKAKETELYQYTLQTHDKDNDSIFLKLLEGPKGMTFDQETKTLSWKPGYNDAGKHFVKLSASDVYDEKQQTFNILVEDTNRLPRIDSQAPKSIAEGKSYRYTIKASDPDKDVLQHRLLNGPQGMSLDPKTGLLTWNPDYLQAGQHAVRVQVNDGKKGYFVQTFNIEVENVNRGPKIGSKPILVAKENSPYRYRLLAEDADLDGLTITLNDGPDGMYLDKATNSLHWVPNFDAAGQHEVELIVSDGTDEQLQRFVLQVKNVNRDPVLQNLAPQQTKEGQHLEWVVKADDPDKQKLSYALLQAPKGMVMEARTGKIKWSPDYEQAGSHQVWVQVTDEEGARHEGQLSVVVDNVNRAPKVESKAIVDAQENHHYFYNFSARDDDDDVLSYKILSAPKGMQIDSKTGYVNWKPDFNSAGQHQVTLAVSDGFKEVKQHYTVKVDSTNRAPSFASKPVVSASETKDYAYSLKGKDADQDKLTFRLVKGPEGMTLDSKQNAVRWTPTYDQAGFHQVVVELTDGKGGLVEQFFNLEVKNRNRQPKFISQPIASVQENRQYLYQLVAEDADGDRLKYKLLDAPPAMKLDPYSHTLTWRPGYRSAGKKDVKVSVTDGKHSVEQRFSIEVQNQNRGPKINSVAPVALNEGETYEYMVLASDLDTDELTYSLVTAPRGMIINEKSGLIEWVTGYDDAGQHGVEVEVNDGKGETVRQSYTLNVANKNRLPEFLSTPVVTAEVKQAYRYQLHAKDPDWNILSYSLNSAPKGMRLDKKTNTIYWDAEKIAEGKHNVIVELSDGEAKLEQNFEILVKPPQEFVSVQ